MSTKNRLLLYAFYDRDGIVDDYVVYQLEQMKTQVDKIVMICQGGIREDNHNKAESIADQVICRDNNGYDAGAWRDAIINNLGWDEIEKYDELILMNDSCYGPIFPINELFVNMEKADNDFWGITESGKFTTKKKKKKKSPSIFGDIPHHIHPYFLDFSNSVLKNKEFHAIWENNALDKLNREEAYHFLADITPILLNCGFKFSVYSDIKQNIKNFRVNYDHTIFSVDRLVAETRIPFVKKTVLGGILNYQLLANDGSVATRTLNFIDNNTDYNTNLIMNNLLRTKHIKDLYELYHWDYILPENQLIEKVDNCKIALIMHLYYEGLFEYCYEYAKALPNYADLYITVGSEKKKKQVEEIFVGLKCNKLEIRVVDNKGMDISALLVGARDVFSMGYNYVGFIHDKRSFKEGRSPRMGEGFCDNLFKSMLFNSCYIENIISTMNNNEALGLLVPPYPMSGSLIPGFGNSWHGNCDGCIDLARKLNIRSEIRENKDTIAVGSVFWCKPKALEPLTSYDWSYDDFPDNKDSGDGDILHAIERILEYCAQSQGYFTGTVMPISHAQQLFSVESFLLRKEMAKNRKLKKKVDSKAYKIGNAITYVPRKAKKLVK